MRGTRRTIVTAAASFAVVLGVGGVAAATSGSGAHSDSPSSHAQLVKAPGVRVALDESSTTDEPTTTIGDETSTTVVGDTSTTVEETTSTTVEETTSTTMPEATTTTTTVEGNERGDDDHDNATEEDHESNSAEEHEHEGHEGHVTTTTAADPTKVDEHHRQGDQNHGDSAGDRGSQGRTDGHN